MHNTSPSDQTFSFAQCFQHKLASLQAEKIWGTVQSVTPHDATISGAQLFTAIGTLVVRENATSPDQSPSYLGEVIALEENCVRIMRYNQDERLCVGDRVFFIENSALFPTPHWCGSIMDAFGRSVDNAIIPQGTTPAPIHHKPPNPALRKPLGARIITNLAIFNTMLPLCQGQRIGLFAAAGVGKSTLLEQFTQINSVDIIILVLIGERGREVSEFSRRIFNEHSRKRVIIFSATSDEPAPLKKRTALAAVACAEHFRRQGKQVLFLFDSLTRYADAHRELALSTGEPPAFRGYPPSLSKALSDLVERTGPGAPGEGDITAIFTVLVAGDDQNEPVADITRGLLDGHVILSRDIAERGRFPAIDLLRSVSRSLPAAASEDENILLRKTRLYLSAYEEVAPMIKAGLYEHGRDPQTDHAIATWPALDQFIERQSDGSIEHDFTTLETCLTIPSNTPVELSPQRAP